MREIDSIEVITPKRSFSFRMTVSGYIKVIQMDRSCLVCLALLSLIGALEQNCCAVEPDIDSEVLLKNRFLHEAPRSWAEYTERAKRLQGKQSLQIKIQTGNKTSDIKQLCDWKNNNCCKLFYWDQEKTTERPGSKKTFSRVYCINSNYAFTLERPFESVNQSSSSPWILTKIMTSPEQIALFHKEFFESDYPARSSIVSANKKLLTELIQTSGFQVGKCRAINRSGEQLVEVEFDIPKQETSEALTIRSGKLLLDPQRYWSVRSYDAQLVQPTGKIVCSVELADSQTEIPVPKRVVTETISSDTKIVWDFKYNLTSPAKLPLDEEFTLTAFGLPEPIGIGQKTMSWYLWLLMAGIACLILAALLRWKVRRDKATSGRE